MLAVKAYFDGAAFIPLEPINAKPNQSAIITILDEAAFVVDKPYKKFIGKLSTENYSEITEVLLETQRVDKNEW